MQTRVTRCAWQAAPTHITEQNGCDGAGAVMAQALTGHAAQQECLVALHVPRPGLTFSCMLHSFTCSLSHTEDVSGYTIAGPKCGRFGTAWSV